MTQRKEKAGICKSVVIAIVVAIRDVKNGFHCSLTGENGKTNAIKEKQRNTAIHLLTQALYTKKKTFPFGIVRKPPCESSQQSRQSDNTDHYAPTVSQAH